MSFAIKFDCYVIQYLADYNRGDKAWREYKMTEVTDELIDKVLLDELKKGNAPEDMASVKYECYYKDGTCQVFYTHNHFLFSC